MSSLIKFLIFFTAYLHSSKRNCGQYFLSTLTTEYNNITDNQGQRTPSSGILLS